MRRVERCITRSKCGGRRLAYVSKLFVYPIKSTRGIAVDQARVDVSGPVWDRRWMLVGDDGVALTQRTLPRMALIVPRFAGEDLVVEAPGMAAVRIRRWTGEGEWARVRIWRDDLRVPHPDAAYSEWFSEFLGISCRLVHLPDEVVRPVEAPWNQEPWRTSLSDAYPLLVLGQASLDLLNGKLAEPVTVARFRPNVLVDGIAAHEEDSWRRVRIGEVEINVVKPCARCVLTLVDPVTAETGIEPLQTLATYRRGANGKVLFAQNALVTKTGVLRVGETVEVLGAAGETKAPILETRSA
jgi:uncharacterized protein